MGDRHLTPIDVEVVRVDERCPGAAGQLVHEIGYRSKVHGHILAGDRLPYPPRRLAGNSTRLVPSPGCRICGMSFRSPHSGHTYATATPRITTPHSAQRGSAASAIGSSSTRSG